MSIDFATLKGLTIPEGNVTEITDASGRVLWSAVKPHPVVVAFSTGAYQSTIDGVATVSTGVTTINSTDDLSVGGKSGLYGVYLNNERVYSSTPTNTVGLYRVPIDDATTHIMMFASTIRGYTSEGTMTPSTTIYIYTLSIVDSESVEINVKKGNGSYTSANCKITYNGTDYTAGTETTFNAQTGDVIVGTMGASNTSFSYNGASTYCNPSYWIVARSADVTLSYLQPYASPPAASINITEL